MGDPAPLLLYVAMTRATRELVLSAHGTSAGGSVVVHRVRDSLAEVARRFG